MTDRRQRAEQFVRDLWDQYVQLLYEDVRRQLLVGRGVTATVALEPAFFQPQIDKLDAFARDIEAARAHHEAA